MTVFVSHSFENKPEFDNIVDALAQASVPYWDPLQVKPGSSLRDQLREAVERCSVCIFVATRRALQSSWCGAELGAFWGAGKTVIVYLAEASLADEDLPPIVQGDVWERRISRVVTRAKEIVADASASAAGSAKPTHVANMTVEQLERLISTAVSLGAANAKSEGRIATAAEIGEAARGAAGSVLEAARATERVGDRGGETWHRSLLWVDDRPENNTLEREAFVAAGLDVTLALSTNEALNLLAKQRFAVIISDMGRKEGPREGYVLLEAVRAKDQQTPFFIYAGSRAPAHQREAAARGAQGTTNIARELFDMVMRALPQADN